jgi:urease accessory protein
MNRSFPVALLICLIVSTTPALAHSPIMGIGGVFGGVIHALLIPEHGLSLLALSLVLGRQQQAARRAGLLIFAAGLVCGLVGAALTSEEMLAADILLVATGILGLFVAALWMPPFLALPLAAVAGITLGLDSKPDGISVDEGIRMLAGSGLGAVLALVIVAEGSVYLGGNAPLIAARVAGSWIAAIGIMVLSLRIVTRITVG